MPNFFITTHQKGNAYKGSQIFILNKGMNSGKPQKEPFTNSFVIQFPSDDEAETAYWLTYSLWKTKFWHQSLYGSVIPFLRITDFKKEFNQRMNQMMEEHEHHKKNVQVLRILALKEEQFHENIKLINDLRRVILYNYCK
jgi:hypothetical protein